MKKLFYLFLLTPFLSISQNINGIVVSSIGIPISDVTVFYESQNIKTLTNKNGEFHLKTLLKLNQKDTLQFSHIGYQITKIPFNELKKLHYKIVLKGKTENLTEVTVQANGKLKLQSKISFTTLSSLKNAVYSFGSLVKDGKIYIIGGDASY